VAASTTAATLQQAIFPLMPALALAMARPAGIALLLPVFTRAQLGGPVRAAFALALALPVVEPAAAALRDAAGGPVWFILLSAKEVFAGALLGLLFGMPIWAVQSAGEIVDVQRSATSGSASEPGTGNQDSTLGGLLSVSVVTVFVAAGGLGAVADCLYASFGVWPLGQVLPRLWDGWPTFVLHLLDRLTRVALVLAAPLLLAALVAEAGVMLLSRAVPKFNVYDLAPTLRNLVFSLMLVAYAGFLMAYAEDVLGGARDVLGQLKALIR